MKRLLFAFLFLSDIAFSQAFLPALPPVFTGPSSAPAANGRLCTTATGTNTSLATYSDPALTSPLPNPITLSGLGTPQTGGGISTLIYLQAAVYRIALYANGTGNTCNGTSVGGLIWQRDDVFLGTGGGGGGGSALPGGSSGQIQYNNSGVFGGFTMGGDCTFSQPNITCIKTSGVSFATSATTDTTSASNITSGTLSISRLPSLAAHSYIGNNTGSSGASAAITTTQLTADLNAFTSSLKGLVPASGGGTTNFLRADGTFAAPPGPGGGTVTTTGSPINGNLTKFSGGSSITPGDLSGDCTTAGDLVITCTKSSGTAFAASATVNALDASNINTGALTGIRVNPRTNTTASSSSITINSDTTDVYAVTALAANLTVNAPSGTPVNGQRLLLRLKDNGTSRTLTFDSAFRGSGDLPLPTATTISKTQYDLFLWNSTDSKWDLLAILGNF